MSRTEEIAIKYYGDLPVLLHDIDPRVDQSRDSAQPGYAVAGYAALTDPVPDGISADYQMDGGILVIMQGHTLLPDQHLQSRYSHARRGRPRATFHRP